MALDKARIVDDLSNATVIEIADLVKDLESKWGVTAAATATGAAAVTPHLDSRSFTKSAISITVALLKSSTILALSSAIVTFQFVSSSPVVSPSSCDCGTTASHATDGLSSLPATRRFTLLFGCFLPVGETGKKSLKSLKWARSGGCGRRDGLGQFIFSRGQHPGHLAGGRVQKPDEVRRRDRKSSRL